MWFDDFDGSGSLAILQSHHQSLTQASRLLLLAPGGKGIYKNAFCQQPFLKK